MPPKSGEASQSVAESNKLRASLGIQRLKEDEEGVKGTSKDPVHMPADKKAEPAKEDKDKDNKRKAAAAKSRREHEELTQGPGLGDILENEEGKSGASDWIARTRGADGSMKGAGANAKKDDGKKRKDAPGGDSNVPKMKVRHDSGAIKEGESVIMTLSDQRLIDKDGNLIEQPDELSNANLLDSDKAKKHDAIRSQVEYDPTKPNADILDKYDEPGAAPSGFMIGGVPTGVIDERDPEKRLAILTAMSENQSLDFGNKFQSDFYTSDEMAKFKKPTKKPKRKNRTKVAGDKEDQIGDPSKVHVKAPTRPDDAGSDEEDPELYEQLSKQRRLVKRADTGQAKKGEAALSQVSERIQSTTNEEEDETVREQKEKELLGFKKETDQNVALTATTEFCNVVQTPIEKIETLKHESFRGSTLYKQQATQRKGIAAGERKARKAGLEEVSAVKDIEEELEQTLIEESLDLSCASGLEYLRARSQIGCDQDSHRIRKLDNRPLEMSTVDGDIKLEYRDDFGRVQTPKEAFRSISWKFHGKVPGRKNMERRLLRLENENRLKSMNELEDALPTLRALKHVQVADAKPYMVLSGANEK
mmetsp:Transcript_112977/g.269289  ORF Transcript_112977/g.269289 Transcript_112977/m.269289 type:complete len:590 (-) Transcript_112977:149-1918(-)|eukprot:CAMPEP_0181429026 /NCGR_PEP_ID=MMETSP1110-20121109/16987_1 /TAXON_ID=174948 /ORGANISM="Symbiodinium sp., Strain CCMP421" /LENGTH=589 /DNA_ID=CAMNT_0023552281 /DNA_START=86 /DNA_END=1855 /DNA_ORIENTATION=+